jgi:hypothetical protein
LATCGPEMGGNKREGVKESKSVKIWVVNLEKKSNKQAQSFFD